MFYSSAHSSTHIKCGVIEAKCQPNEGKCWRQTTSNAFSSTRMSRRVRWETVSSSIFPLHMHPRARRTQFLNDDSTTMAAYAEARATLQLRTTQIFHIPIAFDTTISPARTPNIHWIRLLFGKSVYILHAIKIKSLRSFQVVMGKKSMQNRTKDIWKKKKNIR